MTSEYYQDIFQYYKSKNIIHSPNDFIIQANRNKVFKWLHNFCELYNLTPNTFQLSIEISHNFLIKNTLIPPNLQLIAMVSLLISIKYYNDSQLPMSKILDYCSNKFALFHFLITEIYILHALEWKICIPTASEVLRVLLLATQVKTDFSKIFEKSDAFVVCCYTEGKFCSFSSIEVAIVSVVCALEQYTQIVFRNQWLNFVVSRLEIDVDRLDNCKKSLIEKLILTTPVNDINKIECLTREKISSLIIGKNS